MQFSEYLSMDRYKHDSSTLRTKKVRCAPKTIKAESFDSIEKSMANGTGELNVLSLKCQFFFVFSHLCCTFLSLL